jgi:hypothetical protein
MDCRWGLHDAALNTASGCSLVMYKHRLLSLTDDDVPRLSNSQQVRDLFLEWHWCSQIGCLVVARHDCCCTAWVVGQSTRRSLFTMNICQSSYILRVPNTPRLCVHACWTIYSVDIYVMTANSKYRNGRSIRPFWLLFGYHSPYTTALITAINISRSDCREHVFDVGDLAYARIRYCTAWSANCYWFFYVCIGVCC